MITPPLPELSAGSLFRETPALPLAMACHGSSLSEFEASVRSLVQCTGHRAQTQAAAGDLVEEHGSVRAAGV